MIEIPTNERRSENRPTKGSLLKELRESREAARQAKRTKRKKRSAPAELKTSAQITFPINIRNLSEAIGPPGEIHHEPAVQAGTHGYNQR